MLIKINTKDDLVKVAGYTHDSGFRDDDLRYDPNDKIFTLMSKEYLYKGRFIQRKTEIIKAECKLTLRGVQSCDVQFASKSDANGYKVVGEDYVNTIQLTDDRIIIITMFQRIKLHLTDLDGEFTYFIKGDNKDKGSNAI